MELFSLDLDETFDARLILFFCVAGAGKKIRNAKACHPSLL